MAQRPDEGESDEPAGTGIVEAARRSRRFRLGRHHRQFWRCRPVSSGATVLAPR